MNKQRKLRDKIDRDNYWMGAVFILSAKSVSQRQQCCVIVNSDDEILSMEVDGFDLNHCPHAEIKCLLNSSKKLNNSTAYITHTPCYQCVLALILAQVRRIVYFKTKEIDGACKDFAIKNYSQIEEFDGNLNWMRDHIKTLNIF